MLDLQDILKTEPVTGPAHRPVSIAEVGLRQTVLEDLALKTLYLSGPFSVLELSKLTRLSFEVASELLKRLRTEQLCQVTGLSGQIPNRRLQRKAAPERRKSSLRVSTPALLRCR